MKNEFLTASVIVSVALAVISSVIAFESTDRGPDSVIRDFSGRTVAVAETDSKGRRHGKETTYHQNGSVASESRFEHGLMTKQVKFQEDGRETEVTQEDSNHNLVTTSL